MLGLWLTNESRSMRQAVRLRSPTLLAESQERFATNANLTRFTGENLKPQGLGEEWLFDPRTNLALSTSVCFMARLAVVSKRGPPPARVFEQERMRHTLRGDTHTCDW